MCVGRNDDRRGRLQDPKRGVNGGPRRGTSTVPIWERLVQSIGKKRTWPTLQRRFDMQRSTASCAQGPIGPTRPQDEMLPKLSGRVGAPPGDHATSRPPRRSPMQADERATRVHAARCSCDSKRWHG